MNNWNRVIYKMTSKINGEYYIGKCLIKNEYRHNPLNQIKEQYYGLLKTIDNKTTDFQRKIIEIGIENFDFIILDYCNYDERYQKENIFQKYLANETNPNLLLYREQQEYVKYILDKEE